LLKLVTGRDFNFEPQGVSEEDFARDMGFGGEKYRDNYGNIRDFRVAKEREFNSRMEYKGSPQNQAELIQMVTEDILDLFGGVNEITSFKVLGGAIYVNGYCYNCKAGDLLARSLPYDLRREINAGNIGRLFDYSQLLKMRRLRDLEFDSPSFVYDYVSYGMGYGSTISVDRFFDDLRALQVLAIGRKLFKRDTYMSVLDEDDVFYQPKASTRFANYSEEVLGRASNKSWDFAKNTMKSKDYSRAVKVFLVVGGATGAAVAGVSRFGVNKGRKAARGLRGWGRDLKSALDDSKNFK